MATYIALLRAVNLGGATQIAMGALREECERLGFERVRSILQSGNLVFDSSLRDPARIERILEAGVAKDLRCTTEFFVRSASEWRALVAANPFPKEAVSDPGHLLVTVLKDPATPAGWTELARAIVGRERVVGSARHGYLYYPDGVGRSKVTALFIERYVGVRGTSRNWNTVGKLAALAGG